MKAKTINYLSLGFALLACLIASVGPATAGASGAWYALNQGDSLHGAFSWANGLGAINHASGPADAVFSFSSDAGITVAGPTDPYVSMIDSGGAPAIGFMGATAVSRTAYTITNAAGVLRTMDTSTVSLGELARIIATMLKDQGDVTGNGLYNTTETGY